MCFRVARIRRPAQQIRHNSGRHLLIAICEDVPRGIPTVVMLIRDELKHIPIPNSRPNPAEPLINCAHRAVEYVVQWQREPVGRAVRSTIGHGLARGYIILAIWICPTHVHIVVRRRHICDIVVVGHRESLDACEGVFPR